MMKIMIIIITKTKTTHTTGSALECIPLVNKTNQITVQLLMASYKTSPPHNYFLSGSGFFL